MELLGSKECKKEIDSMRESEERYWHQRARVDWLKFGENNTKFFHATTLQHRRMNSICKIKKMNGEWIEETKEISMYLQHHFQGIYSKDKIINFQSLEDIIPSIIGEEVNKSFCKVVYEEELKVDAFSTGSSKALGPDGFSGSFYHSFWDIIKDDHFAMVLHFFSSSFLDYDLNKTTIVLIPKTKNPCEVHHFRPINFYNFSMKVVRKGLPEPKHRNLPKGMPWAESRNQESGNRNHESGIRKQESRIRKQESGNRKQKSENMNQESGSQEIRESRIRRKQAYSIRRKYSFRNTFQKSGCSTGRIHTSKADQGSLLSTGLPTLYGGARTGNNRSAYGNRVGRAGLSG
ncbi:hypothetical protein GQ457_07G003500 [Hibiscus cannabinus]